MTSKDFLLLDFPLSPMSYVTSAKLLTVTLRKKKNKPEKMAFPHLAGWPGRCSVMMHIHLLSGDRARTRVIHRVSGTMRGRAASLLLRMGQRGDLWHRHPHPSSSTFRQSRHHTDELTRTRI